MTNKNLVNARFIPDLFGNRSFDCQSHVGSTIKNALYDVINKAGFHPSILEFCQILLNGQEIAHNEIDKLLLKEGDNLNLIGMPGKGGKNWMGTILAVVVMAAATVATWGAASAISGTAWGTAAAGAVGTSVAGVGGLSVLGATAAYASGMVVAVGGMAILNSVFSQKIKTATQADDAVSNWYISEASNTLAKFDVLPLNLGKLRTTPRYIAQPYNLISGDNVDVYCCFGMLGHNKVSELRLGATALDNFTGVEAKIYEKWDGSSLKFFDQARSQETIDTSITRSAGPIIRTTGTNAVQANIIITLPNGLVYINKKGYRYTTSVSLDVRYSKTGENNWKYGDFGISATTVGNTLVLNPDLAVSTEQVNPQYAVFRRTFSIYARTDNGQSIIIKSTDNTIAYSGTTAHRIATVITAPSYANIPTIASVERRYTSGPAITISADLNTVYIGAGNFGTGATWTFSGNSTAVQYRGINLVFPEPGKYDIRISRNTSDQPDTQTTEATFNKTTWTTLQTIKDSKAIIYDKLQGAPITIIELKLRATEQLSGNVDSLNAIFHSYAPIWDSNNNKWAVEPTNNNASLCLMTATTSVIRRPISIDELDMDEFAELYKWCEKHGWHYNGLVTSETTGGSLWESILSGCRAIKTMKNGLISVAWDDPDKLSVFSFGARNSAGFTIKKNYAKDTIHALRCAFVNENADYQEDELLVYNDGYNEKTAINISEFSKTGTTNPDIMYKHARLHLAEIIHRDISCEWNVELLSHLVINHFERVSVNHPVAMWGHTQCRAIDLVKDETTGDITHIIIDDYVTIKEDTNYVLVWQKQYGETVTYFIESSEYESTRKLKLTKPIIKSNAPVFDALMMFGATGMESKDLIVVGLSPQSYNDIKVTAHAAAPEIYKAIDGPIPEFISSVTIPDRWLIKTPNMPIIRSIVTDEWALLKTSSGSKPRIEIRFEIEGKEDVTIDHIACVYRMVGSTDWVTTIERSWTENLMYINDVQEESEYEFRLYSSSTTGDRSVFTPLYTTIVIGRTTPPPSPIAVMLEGTKVRWIMPEFIPVDVIGYEVLMTMHEDDPFAWAFVVSNPITQQFEFDFGAWAGRGHRIWVRTVDEIGLYSEPVSVVYGIGDLIVTNVVHAIKESEREWPGGLIRGNIYNDRLYATGDRHFMTNKIHFMDRTALFLPNISSSMIYTSVYTPPAWVSPCYFQAIPTLSSGRIISMEYRLVGSNNIFMGRHTLFMSKDIPFMSKDIGNWNIMTDYVALNTNQAIQIRLTTAPGEQAVIDEIEWIFDVDDATYTVNNLYVPNTGIRLPVPEGHFRWITAVTFGIQYFIGNAASTVVREDDGVVVDNVVTEGPFVRCLDKNGNNVQGNIDAYIVGASNRIE